MTDVKAREKGEPRARARDNGDLSDPRAPAWTRLARDPFPEWVQGFRDHQLEAVESIVRAYGKGARTVWLDAPTGSGKTLIADAVRRLMAGRALYVCSTIGLQSQVLRDFPYARVLKGRANYPTQRDPTMDIVTCADCDVSGSVANGDAECSWCPEVARCEYRRAKEAAIHAPLAVLNTAYFLAEANWQGGFSNLPFVIVDECDLTEKALMGFVGLEIGPRVVERARLTVPKKGSHMTTVRGWLEGELLPALGRMRGELGRDVEGARERVKVERMMQQIGKVVAREDGWVRDVGDEERARGGLVLKPVGVSDVAKDVLWRHGQKWLLMSGTVVSAEMEAESLGLGDGEWDEVRVPMSFPVENRPIYFCPVARNTRKGAAEEGAEGKIAKAVRKVVERYPGDKVLVHAVSYRMTKLIVTELEGPHPTPLDMARGGEVCGTCAKPWPCDGVRVFSHEGSRGRGPALEGFLAWDGGCVLVSPSMDRGVDLAEDACLPAGTQVLCRDMTWQPIEKLQPGDEIIGVDEELPAKGHYRKLRHAVVEATTVRRAVVYRIETTHGVVRATAEHPFLTMDIASTRRARWRTVSQMRPGHRMWWVGEPCQQDQSWEAGYLAGFFDGEGYIDGGMTGKNYRRLVICGVQVGGVVMNRVLACLDHLGFTYKLHHRTPQKPHHQRTWEIRIAGNLSEKLRFLSTVYPERLVRKVHLDGLTGRDLFCARVLSIEPDGEMEVHNLQTSTNTFIADGFVTHNCRVVVVTKMPYLSLGDRQVSERLRMKGGRLWYDVATIRGLVQMTGRAVRSEDDRADSWIIDSEFGKMWRQRKGLLPAWWRDAVETVPVRGL